MSITNTIDRNFKPGVKVKIGNDYLDLSPKVAREYALDVYRASLGAELDAFFFEFLSKKMGIDNKTCVQVLSMFKEFKREKELEET